MGNGGRIPFMLARFLYPSLSRRDKGTVVCYLMKVTGYPWEAGVCGIRGWASARMTGWGVRDAKPRTA